MLKLLSKQSDQFYNGGWTEDVRCVINHTHTQFPEAPLFLAGASLGANMMVKDCMLSFSTKIHCFSLL